MYTLAEYVDIWNYTFVIVALIAISIGTILAIRNIKHQKLRLRREKRSKK